MEFITHQLRVIEISNKNVFNLGDLFYKSLQKKDNSQDIGSNNYIKNSQYKFLKTKIANPQKYIIDISNNGSYENMNYNAFVFQNLNKNDILISKDSNIGECCILNKDYPNCMMASAFYKLPIHNNKLYIFGYMKTMHFKNQLDLLVPRGSTIRHAGTRFLECTIPFPTGQDANSIIKHIEFLIALVIKKENEIFDIIDKELKINIIKNDTYVLPTINNFIIGNRIDAGYYCKELFKINSLIKNYKNGYKTIFDWGYKISRGQNLQVSCIGKSKNSKEYITGYYKVAKPTNLSDYGTVNEYEYLGNKNESSLLKDGDIVFSAEETIGKCAMFNNINEQKIITNIHGIILNKKNHDVVESGFVCSFLRYLRNQKVFDYLSVGGQGGSLAMKYWDDIIIPKFPKAQIKMIANLYCIISPHKENFIAFENYTYQIIKEQSIQELNESIKNLKNIINSIYDYITYNNEFKKEDIHNIINNYKEI